jgi:hypothetical protein
MQPTYMRSIDIRRIPDNSIDHDLYRRRAARLRAKAMRDVAKRTAAMIGPLIAIALLIGTVLAMPTRSPESVSQTADTAMIERIVALRAD